MSSLISSYLINEQTQTWMRSWLPNGLEGRMMWIDKYMKQPLHDLIYYNSTTLAFAENHPGLFSLTILFTAYVITIVLAIIAGKLIKMTWPTTSPVSDDKKNK